MVEDFRALADFIWKVADLLRGDFKRSRYGRIILPFTLLRRLECVLEPRKEDVLKEHRKRRKHSEPVRHAALKRAAGHQFYNTSELTLATLSENAVMDDLMGYVRSFSPEAQEIFEHFDLETFVDHLNSSNLLYQVVREFASMDLSPRRYPNYVMGLAFEELIRRFAESSNETAGEHFTPRDVVHLVTSLIFTGEGHKLKKGKIVTIYDPTAGTGGFLSESHAYVQGMNTGAVVRLFGQELNPESYAICKADMLIKNQQIDRIHLGNTLSHDKLDGERFDFLLSNPPFGVDWKKVQKEVKQEHRVKGYDGRFGPGLPRISDGAMLFLLHLIKKMKDAKKGSGGRIGIILNGSPLFTGGAGSGESEIRRYILEHDLLEAIVALPTDMFYNTGIATYVWILSNHKPRKRRGKVQLINATDYYSKMRRSLGSKRRYLEDSRIDDIVRTFGQFTESDDSLILDTTDFGYRRITVERPLRLNFSASPGRRARLSEEKTLKKMSEDEFAVLGEILAELEGPVWRDREEFEKALKAKLKDHGIKLKAPEKKAILNALSERDENAEICTDAHGNPEPDTDLRDYENVPLSESVEEYFEREVKPHVEDAWIDEGKCDEKDGDVGVVGYEIPFNRYFYKYEPPRPLEEIDGELRALSHEIQILLQEVTV